jgi:hypothetical protein
MWPTWVCVGCTLSSTVPTFLPVEGLHGGDHADERGVSADELVQALLRHLLSRMVGASGRAERRMSWHAGWQRWGAWWRRGARGLAAEGASWWEAGKESKRDTWG